jgi:hypothetical protein
MCCILAEHLKHRSIYTLQAAQAAGVSAFALLCLPPTMHAVESLPSETTARSHIAKLRTGATSSARLVRACLASATLHSVSVAPILRRSGCRTEPALHCLWCEDVVLASTERRPDACEEVVQVCGDETKDLSEGSVLAVDDECHKQQSERQELGVKVHDEEIDLTGGVVLGERVRVCEREGGEERVTVKKHTCGRLSSPSASLLSSKRAHIARAKRRRRICREPTPPSRIEGLHSFLK